MKYSQNNEQQYILEYFKGITGKLIDIGANDGITLSNSMACIERGWQAVLVEPSRLPFNKLSLVHKGNTKVKCFNVAIADKEGLVDFYDSDSHLKNGDTGLLSTLKQSETLRWGNTQKFEKVTVQCITIPQLLVLADAKIEDFDLILIDAEGVDYDILMQIDLSNTKMLIIETNSIEDQKYIDYCAAFDMKVLHKNIENIIFVK